MSSLAGETQPAPESWRKSISEKDAVLGIQVAAWLTKRGKCLRPKLNDEQKQQLEECFELMDADGSGAIDADELGAAFKLLGLHVKKAEIGQLLDEVDSDGSGEVEYPEFIEIMTSTLAKLAEKKEQQGAAGNQVPFALLATAYRRKRIMEGLISGDKEMTAQVVAIAEEATRRAAEEAAVHHQAEESAARRRRASNVGSDANRSVASFLLSPSGSCNDSTRSSSLNGVINSPNSAGSGGGSSRNVNTGAAIAMQAGTSGGLLRTLNKMKSLKTNPVLTALEGRTGGGSDGNTEPYRTIISNSEGAAGWEFVALGMDVTALLGEKEQAQLAEVLKAAMQKRLQQQQRSPSPSGAATLPHVSSDRGSPLPSNSSISVVSSCREASAAAAAAAIVGANQHMTSKLQQRVLTQDIQVPKFSLSVARSGMDGTAESSRSKSRSKSTARSQTNSPIPSIASVASAASGTGSLVAAVPALFPSKGRMARSGSSKSATDLCSLAAAGSCTASSTAAATNSAPLFGDCTILEHRAQLQQQQHRANEGYTAAISGLQCSSFVCGSSNLPASIAANRSKRTNLALDGPLQSAAATAAVGMSYSASALLPQAGALSPPESSDVQQRQPRQQAQNPAQQSSKSPSRHSCASISASCYAAVGTGSAAAAVAASIAAGSSGGDGRGVTADMKCSLLSKLHPSAPVSLDSKKQQQQQQQRSSGGLIAYPAQVLGSPNSVAVRSSLFTEFRSMRMQ